MDKAKKARQEGFQAFEAANGLYYAAWVDCEGFHRQGVGVYPSAKAALSAKGAQLEAEEATES